VIVLKEGDKVVNTAFKTGPDEWSLGGMSAYCDSLRLTLYAAGRDGLTMREMVEL
jgi:hypothetical protein